MDVLSQVAEPEDHVAKALAPSVRIYVPAMILKIDRWAMAMIKRKFNLHQKMKMMMENLIIKVLKGCIKIYAGGHEIWQ